MSVCSFIHSLEFIGKHIYEKLKVSDILVVVSQVYFYGVSAQLKALIDRLHTPITYTK